MGLMSSGMLDSDALWIHYQRGYRCLVRNGLFFRAILRSELSHAYFRRVVPLLAEYARANQEGSDLPPGFGSQMDACLLTPRDLLHLDYAICLGYAEACGDTREADRLAPVLDWPGPGGYTGVFVAACAADAVPGSEETVPDVTAFAVAPEEEEESDEADDREDEDPEMPFDM